MSAELPLSPVPAESLLDVLLDAHHAYTHSIRSACERVPKPDWSSRAAVAEWHIACKEARTPAEQEAIAQFHVIRRAAETRLCEVAA